MIKLLKRLLQKNTEVKKDCEHGYHNFEEIYGNMFDFPMNERIDKCTKCGLERYKYYDCYMGNIFYEEIGYGFDIKKLYKSAGISSRKIKQDGEIFKTQKGRKEMMYNKICGGYYD